MSWLQWNGRPLTPLRVLRGLQVRVHDRLQPLNTVRGVYGSFAEATAAAPSTKPVGYNSANAEAWYFEKHTRVQLEDYPVLYWLRAALDDSSSLLEIGGHVGVAYYGFATVLEYPPDLTWTILDVPAIMAAGEALARERGRTNLRFAHEGAASVPGADILLAAGALQYLETDLADFIGGLRHGPRHVILNVTPVYDGPAFVTVQNIGTAYCAYRVFNRQGLVLGMKARGYQLVDSWVKPRRLRIPGRPERTLDDYSGFYFRKA